MRRQFSFCELISKSLFEKVYQNVKMAIQTVIYIYAALGLLGLLANIAQIVSMVITDRRHSIFEISLLSLCCADMLSALTMSAYGLYITAFKRQVTLSNIKYLDVGLNTTITVALMTMNLIAMQRLLATVYPLKFKVKFTRRKLVLILAVTWVVPFLYGIIGTLFINKNQMLQINSVITLSTCILLILQYGIIYYFLKSRSTTTRNRASTRSVLFHSVLISASFVFSFTPFSIHIFLSPLLKKELDLTLGAVFNALVATNPFLDTVVYFFVYNCRARRATVNAARQVNNI